ncbi:Npt1/Npt2 family nucleotide transporter [Guyparkeria halophila]|uniref:ADP,ATP carrier protein n=1 Tax=Guyparkeria halophila TaxID=47960 RepID=A0ABZ0YUP0_9GAMM|nr:Npt1/Npt2 family nucleotide transporter [Guyparkeria halophila]WQH15895.1 Npt1/Npt2 family nucleotide transporter [Guyparkeria halophila]
MTPQTDSNHPGPSRPGPGNPEPGGFGARHPWLLRRVLLFTNFFLIIAAVYHLKPASRSLFLSALGADALPYVWIATATALALTIGLYHRLIARYSRIHVVLGTCAVVITVLLGFYPFLDGSGFAAAFAFYVFVDMVSVILVEQFWSLTNTIFSTREGKRWYGFIATGGLVGGVAGGMASSAWIREAGLETMDLLPIAAAIIGLIVGLTLLMGRTGLYREKPGVANHHSQSAGDWRAILRHRYLLLIAGILLLAQIAEPIIEYQFMKVVEATVTDRDARTAYLGAFFGVLSAVAIGINLLITPLVHRWLGVLGGLFAQPIAVVIGSVVYLSQATLQAGAFLKIADRGLSYSINRASKELLYVPIEPLLMFRAKAWIDMFGYRLFKVAGSLLILLLTQWLPWPLEAAQLAWVVVAICLLWMAALTRLGSRYRGILDRAEAIAETR